MCGIAGLWRRNGGSASDGERLARMAQTLRHRGPDDYGYLLADSRSARSSLGQTVTADFVPDVMLASRRLSIIDLSPRGRQPMANETGDVFVVFQVFIAQKSTFMRSNLTHSHLRIQWSAW